MEYITKERFERNIKSTSVVELVELVKVIEEEFGYSVSLAKKDRDKLTEEQKKRMTKAVFENKEILRQLDQSEWDQEENDITDPHEFAKLLR